MHHVSEIMKGLKSLVIKTHQTLTNDDLFRLLHIMSCLQLYQINY